ncbi:unnamed protein product [Orchesella dallaii]|uniref:Uncharacterized protein n=1 Tax=Orchesella dallaii TaxID=48710 RepID=A0ABP1R659_9HEXA
MAPATKGQKKKVNFSEIVTSSDEEKSETQKLLGHKRSSSVDMSNFSLSTGYLPIPMEDLRYFSEKEEKEGDIPIKKTKVGLCTLSWEVAKLGLGILSLSTVVWTISKIVNGDFTF